MKKCLSVDSQIPVDISLILGNLITVIFDYQKKMEIRYDENNLCRI